MRSSSDQKKPIHARGMMSYEKRSQISFDDDFDIIFKKLKQMLNQLINNKSPSTIDELMDQILDLKGPLHKHIDFFMEIPHQSTFCGKRILQSEEFWTLYLIIFNTLNTQQNQYISRLKKELTQKMQKFLTQEQIIKTHNTIDKIEAVQQINLKIERNIQQAPKKLKIVILPNKNIQSLKLEDTTIQAEIQEEVKNQDQVTPQKFTLENEIQEMLKESVAEMKEQNEVEQNLFPQFDSLEKQILSQQVEFFVIVENVGGNNCHSIIQVLEGDYEDQYALYQFRQPNDQAVADQDFKYYHDFLKNKQKRQSNPLFIIHSRKKNKQ